ncbi:a-type inclusion protein [Anaeramoeba flamelloides]|uniref:A-type inclusion protein n=1 Tax=Anaeramoeba flamelloides TaxID=1746091 RepID=A0AAV7ZNN2_9EUKA|nr:a-type inclusion protein [Anaeramoeba flamelloides]
MDFLQSDPCETDLPDFFGFCFGFLNYLYRVCNSHDLLNPEEELEKFKKTLPLSIQRKVNSELSVLPQIYKQIGVFTNNKLNGHLSNKYQLSESWRPVIDNITDSVTEANRMRKENSQNENQKRKQIPSSRQSRTISMLSFLVLNELRNGTTSRDIIAVNTGFARQRICTVLSIFKAMGLINESGKKRSRQISLNNNQDRILGQLPNTCENFFKLKNEKEKKVRSTLLYLKQLEEKIGSLGKEKEEKIKQKYLTKIQRIKTLLKKISEHNGESIIQSKLQLINQQFKSNNQTNKPKTIKKILIPNQKTRLKKKREREKKERETKDKYKENKRGRGRGKEKEKEKEKENERKRKEMEMDENKNKPKIQLNNLTDLKLKKIKNYKNKKIRLIFPKKKSKKTKNQISQMNTRNQESRENISYTKQKNIKEKKQLQKGEQEPKRHQEKETLKIKIEGNEKNDGFKKDLPLNSSSENKKLKNQLQPKIQGNYSHLNEKQQQINTQSLQKNNSFQLPMPAKRVFKHSSVERMRVRNLKSPLEEFAYLTTRIPQQTKLKDKNNEKPKSEKTETFSTSISPSLSLFLQKNSSQYQNFLHDQMISPPIIPTISPFMFNSSNTPPPQPQSQPQSQAQTQSPLQSSVSPMIPRITGSNSPYLFLSSPPLLFHSSMLLNSSNNLPKNYLNPNLQQIPNRQPSPLFQNHTNPKIQKPNSLQNEYKTPSFQKKGVANIKKMFGFD